MEQFYKDHSLSIALVTIFVVMIVASWPLGYHSWDGKGSYFLFWLSQTIFSLEADVFGAILLALLTKKLRERGSPQSKE